VSLTAIEGRGDTPPAFRAFPTLDLPLAEVAFREWMSRLTGRYGDDLEGWLMEQSTYAPDGPSDRDGFGPDNLGLNLSEVRPFVFAAEGLLYAEIAERLHVSTETVRTQMKHGRRRMGARNTTHAVALLIRCGIIRFEGDVPTLFWEMG
jgi:Bacterial regulatory proteins, luxR family